MIHAIHFGGVLVAGWLTAHALLRSRWPGLSPRAAIVCWQAVGLALGLSAIGLPLALAVASTAGGDGTAVALLSLGGDALAGRPVPLGPVRLTLVAAGLAVAGRLLWTTVGCLVRTSRQRRRHRDLLALVARADPAAPGALVLDHPGAAAYCLPGVRPRVVVSAGVLDLLDDNQLAAVLSHERAHARARHDLVLLPFAALCRALPGARWARTAEEAVALLVEMAADDRARRSHADRVLAAALVRFAAAPVRVTPPGALAATGQLTARVTRLLDPGTHPARLGPAVALGVAQLLVAAPLALFLY